MKEVLSPFGTALDGTETTSLQQEESESHLPLVFDVPTLFALAATLETGAPVILNASLCSGRLELTGEGWSTLTTPANDGENRLFQIFVGENFSGQRQQLWVEEGIALTVPGPIEAVQEQAEEQEYSTFGSEEVPQQHSSLAHCTELTCSENLFLDANLLALLAPNGVVLRGEGVVRLTHAENLTPGNFIEHEGLCFTEYVGRSVHGDLVSLLVQQGIVLG